jgi:hypothetical protein
VRAWQLTLKRKKDYTVTSLKKADSVVDGPAPWVMKIQNHSLDFRRWLHQFGDTTKPKVERGLLLDQLKDSIWGFRHEMTGASLENLYQSGLCIFLTFLDSCEYRIQSIQAITEETMHHLVAHLKNQRNSRTGEPISYTTSRTQQSPLRMVPLSAGSRSIARSAVDARRH